MAVEQGSQALQGEDYLWPLTTIRDTLLRPPAERQIPADQLRLLLRHHLPSLQTPWNPFAPPSASSRKALTSGSVTLPNSGASLKVDSSSRDIATRLSELVHVDEVVAFWLFKAYAAYSVDEVGAIKSGKEDDALLERLALWYEQELLAVPQIVMALYVPASEPTGWEDLAASLRPDILASEAAYIEGLFRAFSSLAQKQVDESGTRALFWATLQLRQQEAYLDLLFLVLYQYTTRPAAVSEGLVRGALLSAFGTLQANRDLLDPDPECSRLSTRIRDLLVVIAVESLCLAQIVSPESDDELFGGTLLHARDRIHSVHRLILEQTDDLSSAAGDQLPPWPIAVVCLAWAVALRSLPNQLLPPSTDYFQLDTNDMGDEPGVHIEVAMRALRLSSGLFPWLETILAGPLFEMGSETIVDMAALRRSPLKDLLIGLSELVRLDHIVDRPGLYRSWELLFGGGLRDTSTSVCNNFWAVDYAFAERRAILDHARFPREPAHLPRLLAALTGVSSPDETDTAANTVHDVFDYVEALPYLTVAALPGSFMIRGKEATGATLVELAEDLVLPGATLPKGTKGFAIDDRITAISWRFDRSAWPLVISLLRGAVGLPLPDTPISLVDLGVSSTLPDILLANLRLVRCVLRSPEVASRLLAASNKADRFPGQSLLDIALAVLGGDRPDTATYAIDVIQYLLRISLDDVGQALRTSGFFDASGRRPASVGALIQADATRGEHGLTVALLRLVRSLAVSGSSAVVQHALRLALNEVWNQFSGWRYRDVAKKHEIAALIMGVFDLAIRRDSPVLRQTFIDAASPMAYKPIVDGITQASPLATKLIQNRRWADANIVFLSFDQAVSLLSTMIRSATSVSATALPHSLMSATIGKSPLIDVLFHLLWDPAMQTSSLRLVLRLLRVHLEVTARDPQRPSLSGQLKDVDETCEQLASIALNSAYSDVKPEAWSLLATIVSTQPGCAKIAVDKALPYAQTEVKAWKVALQEGPASLSAALLFLQAASDSQPRTFADDLWQAVRAIADHIVPLPSSFSDDIALDVTIYSHSVQAKANATALLASELAKLDAEGPETKAQSLALSLFRNSGSLQDAASTAVFSCCDPELHAEEAEVLACHGIKLAPLRSICLPTEREYGPQYLYGELFFASALLTADTAPVFSDSQKQAAIGRSLAILNLNWSQLDADVALTKAFRALADAVSPWTEGDALAAKAAMAAAVVVAAELAKEDRGGDVMFAIQTERLGLLATLLETGLDEDPDKPSIKELVPSIRAILESNLFAPVASLRHDDLPPLHRPALHLVLLLAQSPARDMVDVQELLGGAGASFALNAADIVLDSATRTQSMADLPLVLSVLCEQTRVPGWADKLNDVNIVARTLEVLVRMRIVDTTVPPHVHSILVLHLALASSPVTAEKLAVSGLLPAYAENAVAVEAELGRIQPTGSGVHVAWCGMLVVVKALLATLPDTASFARSDVIPFVRVSIRQFVAAFGWNGETTLSRPALEEMALVADIYYGLASSLGAGPHGLLDDFVQPALALLTGVRYALSHPHRFSTLIVPADEEEQVSLERELEIVDGQKDIDLLDAKTPVIRSRTMALLSASRSVALTLVHLTQAWDTLAGDEPDVQLVLGADDSPSADPVGVLNDLYTQASAFAAKLPASSVAHQLAEATALLSLTQLVARAFFLLPEESDDSMDVDMSATAARRRSLGSLAATGKIERVRQTVRELESDVRGMLPEEGTGMLAALRKVAERVFE